MLFPITDRLLLDDADETEILPPRYKTDYDNGNVKLYQKTLLRSSSVHQVLSGNFRGLGQMDLVLVKEDCIQLIARQPDGSLKILNEFAMFGLILSAAVVALHNKDALMVVSDSSYLLFLTVEVTHSSKNRLRIYAEMALPKPKFCFAKIDAGSLSFAVASAQGRVQVGHMRLESKFFVESSFLDSEDIIAMEWLAADNRSSDVRVLVTVAIRLPNHGCVSIIARKFQGDKHVETARLELPENMSCPVPLCLISLPSCAGSFIYLTETFAYFFTYEDIVKREIDVRKLKLADVFVPLGIPVTTIVDKYCCSGEKWNTINTTAGEDSDLQTVILATEQGGLLEIRFPVQFAKDMQVDVRLLREEAYSIACMSLVLDLANIPSLLLFGDSSDGELLHLTDDDEEPLIRLCSIPSACPCLDFKMIDLEEYGHDVIYAVCGQGPFSSLRQIESGIVLDVISSSEPVFNGVTGIWSVTFNTAQLVCLALDFFTRLFLLTAEGELDDLTESRWITSDELTITFGAHQILENKTEFVHVTSRGIYLKRSEWKGTRDNVSCLLLHHQSFLDKSITVAAIGSNGLVVLGFCQDEKISIFRYVFVDSMTIELELLMTPSMCGEPSCLHFQSLSHGQDIIAVGTYQSSVIFLRSNEQGNFSPMKGTFVGKFGAEKGSAPESICFVEDERQRYLLVGLRNGCIVSYQTSSNFEFSNPLVRQLGGYPVRMALCSDPLSVLALTDHPWRIDLRAYGIRYTPVLSDQIMLAIHLDGHSNHLLIICNSCFKTVRVSDHAENKMTSFPLQKSPRRMLYVTATKMIVVGVSDKVNGSYASELQFFDPMMGHIVREYTAFTPGHVISAIREWSHFSTNQAVVLVVAMSKKLSSNEHESLLTFFEDAAGSVRVESELKVHGRIYDVCVFGRYLVVGCGKDVFVVSFSLQNKRLERLADFRLHFNAISVSSYESHFVVGTERDSMLFFKFDEGNNQIVLINSDINLHYMRGTLMITNDMAYGYDRHGVTFGLRRTDNAAQTSQPLFRFNSASYFRPLRIEQGTTVHRPEEYDAALIAEVEASKRASELVEPPQLPLAPCLSSTLTSSPPLFPTHRLAFDMNDPMMLDTEDGPDVEECSLTHRRNNVIMSSLSGAFSALLEMSNNFERDTLWPFLHLLSDEMMSYDVTRPPLGQGSVYKDSLNVLNGDFLSQFIDLEPHEQEELLRRAHKTHVDAVEIKSRVPQRENIFIPSSYLAAVDSPVIPKYMFDVRLTLSALETLNGKCR